MNGLGSNSLAWALLVGLLLTIAGVTYYSISLYSSIRAGEQALEKARSETALLKRQLDEQKKKVNILTLAIVKACGSDAVPDLARCTRGAGSLEKLYLEDETTLSNEVLAAAYTNIAVRYFRQGIYWEAIEWYQRALKATPDDANILNFVAYSYYRLEEFTAGLKFVEESLARNPDDRFALINKLKLLCGLRDWSGHDAYKASVDERAFTERWKVGLADFLLKDREYREGCVKARPRAVRRP